MEYQITSSWDMAPLKITSSVEILALQIKCSLIRNLRHKLWLVLTSITVKYNKPLKTFLADNKHLDKLHTNAKIEDEAPMFGKSGTAMGGTQARPYNDFTKRFDNNYNKIGLRKWESSFSDLLLLSQ